MSAILSSLQSHLWQSTWFAVCAGLLTLCLRRQRAGVRYAIWMSASIKFLLPFSLLVAAGEQVRWRTVSASPASVGVETRMQTARAGAGPLRRTATARDE